MIINLKQGLDKLLFGMWQKDVIALYGTPNKTYDDDEGNVIFLYYLQKMSLTFYQDEDFRLGYIICSHPEITILSKKVIGTNIHFIKSELPFKTWTLEAIDIIENHFNESNWLILQSEYDEVKRVEIGAIINDSDEFDWKFK